MIAGFGRGNPTRPTAEGPLWSPRDPNWVHFLFFFVLVFAFEFVPQQLSSARSTQSRAANATASPPQSMHAAGHTVSAQRKRDTTHAIRAITRCYENTEISTVNSLSPPRPHQMATASPPGHPGRCCCRGGHSRGFISGLKPGNGSLPRGNPPFW